MCKRQWQGYPCCQGLAFNWVGSRSRFKPAKTSHPLDIAEVQFSSVLWVAAHAVITARQAQSWAVSRLRFRPANHGLTRATRAMIRWGMKNRVIMMAGKRSQKEERDAEAGTAQVAVKDRVAIARNHASPGWLPLAGAG